MRKFVIKIGEESFDVNADDLGGNTYKIEVAGKEYEIYAEEKIEKVAVGKGKKGAGEGGKTIVSPIQGVVTKINCDVGDEVKAGNIVCTIVAMKMENEIEATTDGKVKAINIKTNEAVDIDDVMIELE
ncbi:MAG: biotin/lipoyl-containing protein [Candidatus Methanofastidiosia archaeon]